MSSYDLLLRGTTDDVVRATKRRLAAVSPDGAHILSSGNSMSSSVKPENFMAMVNTIKKFGRYPIDQALF